PLPRDPQPFPPTRGECVVSPFGPPIATVPPVLPADFAGLLDEAPSSNLAPGPDDGDGRVALTLRMLATAAWVLWSRHLRFDPADPAWADREVMRPGRRTRTGLARYTVLPWVAEGACRGRGDIFFGPSGERPEARVDREAKARLVCAVCPVLDPCRR